MRKEKPRNEHKRFMFTSERWGNPCGVMLQGTDRRDDRAEPATRRHDHVTP